MFPGYFTAFAMTMTRFASLRAKRGNPDIFFVCKNKKILPLQKFYQ